MSAMKKMDKNPGSGRLNPLDASQRGTPKPDNSNAKAGKQVMQKVAKTTPASNTQKSGAKPTRIKPLKVTISTTGSVSVGAPLPPIKSVVDRFDDMLKGIMKNLPPKPPSEVRIFLSSTFSDMREERNWLVKTAYPRLKAYCYSELDLDFQVVDMRWGVTDDSTNDHDTERLCLREISNCQRISLGPNYVSILGQRYGFRPIPTELRVDEFDAIYQEASAMGTPRVDLMKDWYLLDENAVPPEYVLQPIRSHLPNFGNYTPGKEDSRKQDTTEWWRIFESLQKVIRAGAEKAAAKSLVSQEVKHNSIKSVTEFETSMGLIEAKDPSEHVMCFTRDFDGLDNSKLGDDQAARCIDTHITDEGNKIVDKDVGQLRLNARNAVKKCLPMTHIRTYRIPWQPGGVTPGVAEHKEYLDTFAREFEQGMRSLIDAAAQKRDARIPTTEYYTWLDETLHHLHFCAEKCATFRGQVEILGEVQAYLKNPKCRAPLVIYAESGVGKTSVMARIMQCLPAWFGGDCVRLIRFLGTSPQTTDIYDVIFHAIGQLADVYDQILEPQAYQSMKSLVAYFPRCLRNISRKTKQHIFILLDSVDQLDPTNEAHKMKWLLEEYPANIHIILSTLPKTHGCLDNARKVIKESRAFLELKPIPETTGREIIDAYLAGKGRTLTRAQNRLILDCLEQAPSPLFLRLLLDRALSWRSYTPVEGIQLAATVRDAINKQFADLETKFGATFVRAALGYITVGLNGLTETELEDVLSCDDAVLDEVYQYHSPPVPGIIRIPGLLWARVRHDIADYLAERLSDGRKTMFWYHRQFIEAARERYVEAGAEGALHRALAEMYLAEDGVRKSIELTKRKLKIEDADRQISPQPLSAKNKRKLNALPHHALHAKDVEFAKVTVYCNIKFLCTRMKVFGVGGVKKDIEKALQQYPGDQCLDTILTFMHGLKNSASADMLPGDLLARMSGRTDIPPISRLLTDARQCIENNKSPALLPMYACLDDQQITTSDNQEHLAEVQTSTVLCFTEAEPYRLVTVEKSGKLRIWNADSLTSMAEISLISGGRQDEVNFDKVLQLRNGKFVVVFSRAGNQLKVIDMDTNVVFETALKGEKIAISEGPTNNSLYVAETEKTSVKVHLLESDGQKWNTKEITVVKENLAASGDIDMRLSSSGKFLLFKVLCSDKEVEIILKSEKRNNMRPSDGRYKFHAVELGTGELKPCFRVLTNIPYLGSSWCVYSQEDWVLVGRSRFILVWDLNNFNADQKMSKGTKVPMFYRPEWIEKEERRGVKAQCHGSTTCIARAPGPDTHFAASSEDGFLVVFDGAAGKCVGGYIGTKPNHGNTQVVSCAISNDNKWVLSVGKDDTIVLWSVTDQCKRAFKMSLNMPIRNVVFSPCSTYVALLGCKLSGLTKTVLFKIIPGV